MYIYIYREREQENIEKLRNFLFIYCLRNFENFEKSRRLVRARFRVEARDRVRVVLGS
jgi:hypothetical protein